MLHRSDGRLWDEDIQRWRDKTDWAVCRAHATGAPSHGTGGRHRDVPGHDLWRTGEHGLIASSLVRDPWAAHDITITSARALQGSMAGPYRGASGTARSDRSRWTGALGPKRPASRRSVIVRYRPTAFRERSFRFPPTSAVRLQTTQVRRSAPNRACSEADIETRCPD